LRKLRQSYHSPQIMKPKLTIYRIVLLFLFSTSFSLLAQNKLNCKQWEKNKKLRLLITALDIEHNSDRSILLKRIEQKIDKFSFDDTEYYSHLKFAKALVLHKMGCSEEALSICDNIIYKPSLFSCNHMTGVLNLYIIILKGENRYDKLLDALIHVKNNLSGFPQKYLYNALANMYYHMGEYDLAILNYKHLISLLNNNLQKVSSLHNNIGLAHAEMNEKQKAKEHFNIALKLWNERKEDEIYNKTVYEKFKNVIRNNMLSLDFDQNDSLIYHSLKNEFLKLDTVKYREFFITNDFLLTLTEHAFQIDNYTDGNLYLERIKQSIQNQGKLTLENKCKFEFLCLQYEILFGDNKAALWHSKAYKKAFDQLNKKKRALHHKMYPVDNKVKTELLIEKENALKFELKVKILMYLLIVILICFLLIVWFGYFNHKKMHGKIAEQKRQIQKALTNSEMLLKEMHHRVKNNLQLVSSIAYIEYEENGEKFDFDRFENRIISLSLIHRLLYSTEYLESIPCRMYLEELFTNLQNTTDKPFNYSLQVDDLTLKSEQMISMGLLINELIINTIKHCVPNKGDTIHIEFTMEKKAEWINCLYRDNGSEVIPRESLKSEFSIGQDLIGLLIQKLRGKSVLSSKEGYKLEINFKQKT